MTLTTANQIADYFIYVATETGSYLHWHQKGYSVFPSNTTLKLTSFR